VAELAGVCRPGGGRERAVGHHGHAREQQHAHTQGQVPCTQSSVLSLLSSPLYSDTGNFPGSLNFVWILEYMRALGSFLFRISAWNKELKCT